MIYGVRYIRGHLFPRDIQVTFSFRENHLRIEELSLSIRYRKIKDLNIKGNTLSIKYEDAAGGEHMLVFTGNVGIIKGIFGAIIARKLNGLGRVI